jgi:phage-related tail protein
LDDNLVTQIISRLGVDYSQAILSTQQFAKETAEANLALQKLKTTAGGATGGAAAGQARGYQQLTREAQKATKSNKEYVKTVKDLNKEYSVLGSMAERRISWFLTGSFLFGGAAAMQEAVRTLAQVESDMTTIARITEDVTFNFKEMRDELQGLGVEYGMAWENVSDIAIRWSQAGYNVADTLELTKASLLALNTAELDANYACAA